VKSRLIFPFLLGLAYVYPCGATTCIALKKITINQVCGQVQDPVGSVIPGAKIKVVNQQPSATSLQVQSDKIGNFNFARLDEGDYTIYVEVEGFARASRQFRVQRSKSRRTCKHPLIARMQPGGLCSAIVVAKSKDIK
jgi:hypothetical protein